MLPTRAASSAARRNVKTIPTDNILSRGSHPEMAYDIRNINILCYKHHAQYENGDRESMRIFAKNEIIISELKKEYEAL